MGRKKVISVRECEPEVVPSTTDVLGIAEKLLGAEKVSVKSQDGYECLCSIRVKKNRRAGIMLVAVLVCDCAERSSSRNPT